MFELEHFKDSSVDWDSKWYRLKDRRGIKDWKTGKYNTCLGNLSQMIACVSYLHCLRQKNNIWLFYHNHLDVYNESMLPVAALTIISSTGD